MKKLVLIAAVAAQSIFASNAFAGHRVGNGGDYIRANYISMGEAITEFLKETEQGQKIVEASDLNVADLAATLDIEKVTVVDEVLRDNSGSVVEAIGEPGAVTLNKEAWFQHFENERDIYYLVLHEMLRSAGVNDDNYVISRAISPFPISRRIETRVVPALPLIAEDLLTPVFDLSKVIVGGNGCPKTVGVTRIEFNQEKNILEVRPSAYRNDVSAARPLDRKTCSIAIPVTVPKNKRLVISQIDLLGKADLQAGAKSQISFEAFVAGSSGLVKTRNFAPTAALKGRHLTRRTEVLKSECGAVTNVRLNSSMLTNASKKKAESMELNSVSLYLSLEDCAVAPK